VKFLKRSGILEKGRPGGKLSYLWKPLTDNEGDSKNKIWTTNGTAWHSVELARHSVELARPRACCGGQWNAARSRSGRCSWAPLS